jgi:DNA adenine methylase
VAVTRPVLRYHGGKWKLAPWIISHFPDHRVYVEPFGGGASVMMRKSRSYAEIYNDMWSLVVNVFRVLRDPVQAAKLETQLRLTPFAREEFDQCGDDQITQFEDPVERARRTIFRSFSGFGSASTNAKHSTGFRANSKRVGGTPARDWMNYPDQIRYFVERLQGVIIENRPAIDVIKQHDSLGALHYIDPPYLHSTRNMKRGNAYYAVEMTDEDHRELAVLLHRVKGMVVLSGYRSALYEEMYGDWKMVEHAHHADGAADRVECLWLSPNIKTTLF